MKKTISGILGLVLVVSFAVSPIKTSAATATTAQNEQLIQLLMQMIQLLQAQLAVIQGSEGADDTEEGDTSTRFAAIKITGVGAKAGALDTLYVGESNWIKGSSLSGQITIKIGSKKVSMMNYNDGSVDFIVPELSAGDYTVTVMNADGHRSNEYTAHVIVPKHEVTVLYPDADDEFMAEKGAFVAKWESANQSVQRFDIYLASMDGLSRMEKLASNVRGNELAIQLDEDLLQKDVNRYTIQVCHAGTDVCGVSNGAFTFVASDYYSDAVITSAMFRQDDPVSDRAIYVYGESLGKIEKLEYQVNCCKPVEGILNTGTIGKDSMAIFLPDTYLGNIGIDDLKVRVVDIDGKPSRWFTVID